MITWDFVLQRIKDELSLPFQVLEKTDDEIIDYLRRNALKKFSKFFPSKERLVVDPTDEATQVPNRIGEYLLVDPEGRQIYNVLAFIPTMSHNLILGHPYIGVFNYDSITDYQLAVEKANTLEFFSPYHYTIEFAAPNRLRVTPRLSQRFTIEYERELHPELEDIRPELEDYFVELCLGMFLMNIGRIRRRYSNIQTPFGEIQLNAEDFYSEGKEIVDRLEEKFDRGTLTTVIFDRG